MRIRKCDICKKVIKESHKEIVAGLGLLATGEFCLACGKPVVNFLISNKIIKKEDINQKTHGR